MNPTRPHTLKRSSVFALLPPTPHSFILAGILNRLLKPHVEPECFQPLQHKSISIRVADLKLSFYLGANAHGFVAQTRNTQPTLTISASARDLLRLALRAEDPDTLFFGRRLSMEGDTELGLWFKNTLDRIEPNDSSVLRWLPDGLHAALLQHLLSAGIQ